MRNMDTHTYRCFTYLATNFRVDLELNSTLERRTNILCLGKDRGRCSILHSSSYTCSFLPKGLFGKWRIQVD
jgi:hypothetical protein